MNHFTIVLLGLPAATLLIGCLLTIIAMRGRRIDEHPICRRCGFDLIGSTNSTRCPECGAGISPASTKRGHRAVRRGPLAVGLLLTIPAFLLLLAIGVAALRGTDFEKYKPFWLLMREGDTRAIVELNQRAIVAGSLSRDQERRLVSAALDAQADTTRPWLTAWGDLIESLRASGKISDQDWRRYAHQAAGFALKVRPLIRRGDPVALKLWVTGYRTGARSTLSAVTQVKKTRIDDAPVAVGRRPHQVYAGRSMVYLHGKFPISWFGMSSLPVELGELRTLSDGAHIFHCDLSVEIHDAGPNVVVPPVVTEVLPQSLPIKLVAQNQPTVELVHDPALRDRVKHSLLINGPGSASTDSPTVLMQSDGIHVDVNPLDPPIGMAFDVWVRDAAGHAWRLGPIRFSKADKEGWGVIGPVEKFDGDRVDVILRPSPVIAAATIDLTRIWGEDVIFQNVKVIWSSGTPRPWSRGRRHPK